MRLTHALLLSLCLLSPAMAQDGKPAADKPGAAQPPTTPPAAPDSAQPAEPPKPAAIPVPDGPVLNKKELEGGLILEDIKIGDGYEVKENGAVVALYHGTLKADGKVFDSAFERGAPIAFPLNGVIKGWQQGVPGMKVGGVRRLTVPAALGYGATGAGQTIPPNADLIFVIQLVDAIQIEEVKVGEGDPASGVYVAITSHVIKDKDGKELEKAEASKPYIWIPNECQGITMGMEGMKLGGKRKIHIPKEMNVWNPQFAGNHVGNVPLDVELEMVNLRVLQPRR